MWRMKLQKDGRELSVRVIDLEESFHFSPGALDNCLTDGRLTIANYVVRSEVVEWDLGDKSFDWAIPQGVIDSYRAQHLELPRCVWLYDDDSPAFGRMYTLQESLDKLWEAIYDAIETTPWEDLPHSRTEAVNGCTVEQ